MFTDGSYTQDKSDQLEAFYAVATYEISEAYVYLELS